MKYIALLRGINVGKSIKINNVKRRTTAST